MSDGVGTLSAETAQAALQSSSIRPGVRLDFGQEPVHPVGLSEPFYETSTMRDEPEHLEVTEAKERVDDSTMPPAQPVGRVLEFIRFSRDFTGAALELQPDPCIDL